MLLLEIVLRIFFSPNLSTIYQIDDHLLYKLIPGSSRYFRHEPVNGGGRILIHVDQQGFRGSDIGTAPGQKRVLVYGDSFIEAEGSELADTFVEQLGVALGARLGERIEAINAGVVGYGVDQISLRMDEELPRLHPDLAVVAVYSGNDFGDLVRDQLFSLGPGGTLQQNEVSIAPAMRWSFWLARYAPLSFKFVQKRLVAAWRRVDSLWVQKESQDAWLAGFIHRSLETQREQYRRYVLQGDAYVDSLLGDPYDADIALTPRSESAQYKLRLMDLVIGRIQQTARSDGVPWLLLIIPSPIDVCNHHDLGQVDQRAYPEYRRDTLTGRLEEIARRRHIPFVNLFGPFRGSEPEHLYFRGNNNHWNDAGQRLAASIVADFVVTEGILDGSAGAERAARASSG